ncbi:MAG: hypothetical protein IE931_03470 [Sphingobacteriales bacterium]|nr:hypothetical protein [Sphingobacteriales bacterium]
MTLGFTQTINKKPNYFIQRIWRGITDLELCERPDYELRQYKHKHAHQFLKLWDHSADNILAKLHTIRQDPERRWKAGNDIHFAINNRSANRFQFAPIIPCKSVQRVFMTHLDGSFEVTIDNNFLTPQEILKLALNDGFDHVDSFIDYFTAQMKDGQLSASIIHWTDLKY